MIKTQNKQIISVTILTKFRLRTAFFIAAMLIKIKAG